MPGMNLTRAEAEARSAVTKVSTYDISLDLTTGAETFLSKSTVNFTATPGASTFLDLVADEVLSLEVNGEARPVDAYQDYRIQLDNLTENNTVTVEAVCRYMHTGEGLHRFTDPADGLDYCYSQFEVPDARRVFAVFEQPDMKARFTFHVTTPENWVVFSNSPTPEPTALENGKKLWDFAETELMSSYITAIIAGPYVGMTDSLVSADGREIPLGVYCRQSLLEHLDAQWMFDVTKAGFKFFEKEYGHVYPFRKYDQIFVPEYNAGAMENAGCVTFRDQYIFRSKPTAAQLEALANTVLHELAHMWFGDLVTMKWWNDLWLNESFAEFMSHLALAEGTQWTDAWTGFMARKDWGLTQDQMPSTHPIVAEIRDLEDVEVNFDGITYAKGAAVLRQLVSYVGRENFFKALNEYFNKHSWGNTTLPDLMNELEAASGRDLKAWSKVWLEEAGVTLLRPEVTVDAEGKITELTVVQESFTPGSSLRPHRLAVAGYSKTENGIERVFHNELDVEGAATVVEAAAGIARPDLILVNDGDLGYAKIRLDEESLAFAKANIGGFSDSLTRSLILASAWDMIRDGQMNSRDYLELALSALPAETDITMFGLLLRHIDVAALRYTAVEAREEVFTYVGNRLLWLARAATAETDQQRLLVQAAARRAWSAEDRETVNRLRTGEESLLGLPMDVDMKWDLLISCVANGTAGVADIDALLVEDTTMTGQQKAAQARAAVADAEVKQAAFDAVLFDASLSNDMRIATGLGYWANAARHPELFVANVENFYASLEKVWEDNTSHTAQSIVALGFPGALVGLVPGCDVVGLGNQWLAAHQDAPAGLVRLVSEQVAEAHRAAVAQQA
ncbi:membrane alanyl aminopeptidase [Gleimia coleocanis DSM 15436]|uniref:Aminopeptidase N n=1 Tax=Gleimia coleocanis DSM 15436 TaxID=525245 RepID=C0W1C5_9ACTO|nr:aminopeptidase N [Gleimia coleocanis]EEH63614.1 membrane alanyl aminopeptidase [Gleimia coleocanis DSM 15436]